MKALALFPLLWLFAGCGGATDSKGATGGIRIGEWIGVTANDEALAFTVETLGVTRVELNWTSPCPEATPAISIFTSEAQPIVERTLVYTDGSSTFVNITLVATFDSDQSASGTLEIETNDDGSGIFCDGERNDSWRAAFSRALEDEAE